MGDNNIHDKYFRFAMSRVDVAREFMEQHLPKDVLSITDLSSLKLQKESFIDPNLRQVVSDVLYKAKIQGRDSYIYLLAEHQSTPDRWMPFRLLRYTCNIMAHHIKNNKENVLPVVVPLVFYHGKKIYPYSTDIFDLFGKEKNLAKNTLLKPFHLIDVNTIPDETLKQKTRSGILTFIQKHIYARNLANHLRKILPLLQQLVTEHDNDYIIATIKYVIDAGNLKNVEEFTTFTHELNPNLGANMMTLGERLRAEGKEQALTAIIEAVDSLNKETDPEAISKAKDKFINPKLGDKIMTLGERLRAEGKEQALTAVAINMLNQGTDSETISQATGLSIEIVNQLALQKGQETE